MTIQATYKLSYTVNTKDGEEDHTPSPAYSLGALEDALTDIIVLNPQATSFVFVVSVRQ